MKLAVGLVLVLAALLVSAGSALSYLAYSSPALMSTMTSIRSITVTSTDSVTSARVIPIITATTKVVVTSTSSILDADHTFKPIVGGRFCYFVYWNLTLDEGKAHVSYDAKGYNIDFWIFDEPQWHAFRLEYCPSERKGPSAPHWASDMIPVGYSPEFGPEAPAGAGNAIDAGFAAWNDAGTVFSFALGQQSGQRVNRVRWGDTKVYYPEGGVIAVAITSWDPETLEIQLAEIIFERSLEWATDGSADAYDVQALTAHESGHWLKLSDLYEDACSDETMYGYADLGETKKRTLNAGDIAGIDVIYGESLTGSESEYAQVIYGQPGLVRFQYDMTIEYVIIDGQRIYGKLGLVQILYETET